MVTIVFLLLPEMQILVYLVDECITCPILIVLKHENKPSLEILAQIDRSLPMQGGSKLSRFLFHLFMHTETWDMDQLDTSSWKTILSPSRTKFNSLHALFFHVDYT